MMTLLLTLCYIFVSGGTLGRQACDSGTILFFYPRHHLNTKNKHSSFPVLWLSSLTGGLWGLPQLGSGPLFTSSKPKHSETTREATIKEGWAFYRWRCALLSTWGGVNGKHDSRGWTWSKQKSDAGRNIKSSVVSIFRLQPLNAPNKGPGSLALAMNPKLICVHTPAA